MYFTNGNYIMGGNFKIKKAAPMDDRGTVAKKIDLQNPNLFDGFTYNGMIVSVVDDTINNGLYRLEDKSTLTWKKEGSDVDLTNYYTKSETATLLSNKVDKVTGKGLSTNDFTDTFKQAIELKKVQGISTDSVTKKLVVNYTDSTVANLNINDIITDVRVSGATLDATTNVLTLTSTEGGANVTVDLSDFVNSGELTSALSGKADKIHSHSTSNITGLDATLSSKVTKNAAIIGATKTKITYDSNGLVINGADLSASDIPNLPQSKIINLETNLSSKIDKGVGVVGATKTKITYNNDGIITGGVDLVEADLPNISQAKVTNLVSDLSNKQSSLISGTNIKTINGQSVLGSGDIVITNGGSVQLTGNQTIAGIKTFSSNIVGNITGNSATATKLQTARTINGVAFDGSANITVVDSTKAPLANPVFTGGITENVYNLTGTAITPANGTIQYKTVSANTIFTETLTAGQSVVLRLVNASSYTITFPAMTWVGNTAPVLTANCVIVLWKEQSELYGAYVGSLV